MPKFTWSRALCVLIESLSGVAILQGSSFLSSLASAGWTKQVSAADEQQPGRPAAATQVAALSPSMADALSAEASQQQAACTVCQQQGTVKAQHYFPGLEWLCSQLQVLLEPSSMHSSNGLIFRTTIRPRPTN